MLRKLSDWNCKEKSNTAKWVKMQSLWNNVRSIKKYTKHSSNTLLHLVYFFTKWMLVALVSITCLTYILLTYLLICNWEIRTFLAKLWQLFASIYFFKGKSAKWPTFSALKADHLCMKVFRNFFDNSTERRFFLKSDKRAPLLLFKRSDVGVALLF